MNQKAQFNTLEEIMQMDFPEDRQIRHLKRPNVIRFTLDDLQLDVPLSEIVNEGDLLSWVWHLGGLKSVNVAVLTRFIKLVSEAKQFELFR